jgi:diketogulonate reductase-like aldo/keto reductase
MPRFSTENFPRNLALIEAMAAIARDKNVTTAQLAFAWVRFRGDDIAPLIGARRRVQLYEALGPLDIVPSPEDLAHIEQAMSAQAVAGTRYMPAILAHLDSDTLSSRRPERSDAFRRRYFVVSQMTTP